jgi:hypothetical protein
MQEPQRQEPQNSKLSTWGIVALVVPLLAMLAAAIWYAARSWILVNGPPMPTIGYLAMTGGVLFSVFVGCGLMALLFYSNRHGYDEPYKPEDDQE